MKNKLYTYHPAQGEAKDYTSIYFTPTELKDKILTHHRRPIVRVRCIDTNKVVIRNVRGLALQGLTMTNCTVDYITSKELGLKKGGQVAIEKTNIVDKYFRFFYYSPDSNVRLTYVLFILATIMAVASIFIGLYSIFGI